mmetsp:Transcript_28669/g.54919  ORF Transcript_28669/g.54919 Transcript_28669/m.54919 type:complete len:241 (-) Transcript_28669:323-1045(-)
MSLIQCLESKTILHMQSLHLLVSGIFYFLHWNGRTKHTGLWGPEGKPREESSPEDNQRNLQRLEEEQSHGLRERDPEVALSFAVHVHRHQVASKAQGHAHKPRAYVHYGVRLATVCFENLLGPAWINDERSTFLQVILCGLARGVNCAHPQADVPTEGHEKHGGGTKNTEIYSLEKKLPHASITENARQHQDTMRVPTHDVLLLWIERHSANCPHREVGLQQSPGKTTAKVFPRATIFTF